MEKLFEKEIAECVGLWLAEGDRKTKSEITFTNNSLDLIKLFHKTISRLFEDKKERIRIYVYSNNDEKINISFCRIVNYYIDKRARKPYCILRLASVEDVKKWKKIVEDVCSDKELYHYILRGFFAGEGNLKWTSKSSRTIRISQKEPNKLIEDILISMDINFYFRDKDRNYYIHGKPNWDIFAKFNLADLHPDKKDKFWKMFRDFKEVHYKNNYLINNIYSILEKPTTTRDLSKRFNRSFARIQDVLIDLKKQNKITNFRVGSIDHWTNNVNLIIISKVKKKYLDYLDKPRKTSDCAKKFKVCSRSSFKRLVELENLKLVKRDKDKYWRKTSINKEIIVI